MQDFICISRIFYSHWKDIIAGRDVSVVDPIGNARQFKVGLREGRPAFTNGIQNFADFYSLKDKALVHFKYNEPLTFQIRIFRHDGPEIEYPEVIDLESDSESDFESQDDDEWDNNWDKVVTDRIAEGRNPLVSSPHFISFLVRLITSIYSN